MIEVIKTIKTANKFLGDVCKILKVSPPKVGEGCLNSLLPYTIYRGLFDEKRNIILIANDYDFKNTHNYEKAIKHEVAEFFCFVVRKKILHRAVFSHSDDKLYRSIRSILNKYYPNKPEKFVQYIQKKVIKIK